MKNIKIYFIVYFLLLASANLMAVNECSQTDYNTTMSESHTYYDSTDRVYFVNPANKNSKKYYVQVARTGHINIRIINNSTEGDVRFQVGIDKCPEGQSPVTRWSHDFNGTEDFNIDVAAFKQDYYSQRYTLIIEYTPGNSAPTANDVSVSTVEDTPVTIALDATDPDGDAIQSYPIITSPSNGQLSGAEPNITYTPNNDFTGSDIFTYQACDDRGECSNTANVSIEVLPPATAVDDHFDTTYNTLLNGNVLTNDLGLNIRVIDHNNTEHGLLNFNPADGSFTYLPDERFDGNDTFGYTIQDDLNNTSSATVTLQVHPPRNDLSITKTAPTQSNVGDEIDYTLSIHSDPSSIYITAKNVRVTDDLPTGVIYRGVTAPSGWTCVQTSATVSCDASTIPPGYSGDIIIHAFAPNILGASINHARIGSDTIDPDTSNNFASATTEIMGKDVDLAITKTVSSPTVITTDSFEYTIQVQNSGSADTSGVKVTDTLDPQLGFISIDGGSDWICSHGSDIVCDYVANGGVFAAGSTAQDIVITVGAPSSEMNITNTAKVESELLEANTANNSSSVDVSINDGTSQTQGVPLSVYRYWNLSGDMKLIANANINWDGKTVRKGVLPPPDYNDQANMVYVDTDSNSNTFNSSSSTLTLDANRTIIWAGLYWEGHICTITRSSNNTRFNNTTLGCKYDHLPSDRNTYKKAKRKLDIVKLRIPGSGYQKIQANTLHAIEDTTTYQFSNGAFAYTRKDATYSGFKDITDLVKESGEYSVANLVLTEGMTNSGGNYGGWTILVVYKDDTQQMQYKNITVFNGFQFITTDNNPLSISGFLTPQSGDVKASVAFFTADGDPVPGGVARMQVGKDPNNLQRIGDDISPATNLFNSTMSELGSLINPGVTTTYGVDADRIDVSDFMTNSQTSTSFMLDVRTPSGGVDHYSISMFAFATDLTSPLIDDFSKTAVIIDKDGTRRAAGPDEPIYPDSDLEYTITFENTGDEIAEAVEIFDDFDFDGLSQALDIGHFDLTRLKLYEGAGTTNEVSNANCGYDIADRRVYCRLDSVAIDAIYTMRFVVHVKERLDASMFDTNATNTAYAKYKNPNGNDYIARYETPITHESVGGKSNALNAGKFTKIDMSGQTYISIDAINERYNYSEDRNITTKIVNQPFNIKLVHKNRAGSQSGYEAWHNSKPMPVLVTLENDGKRMPPLGVSSFGNGNSEVILRNLILGNAFRDERFKMAYLDWNTILKWAPSTSACILNNDQSVNLNGLPACFNSYEYVKDIFPTASFPSIAACYGIDANISAGSTYPCNPLAYDSTGTPRGAISPEVYRNPYGCYQCIAEAFPRASIRYSTDNFAARPDRFVFDSNDSAYPDLLRSGRDYNLTLHAPDGANNDTLDYNTTGQSLRMADPTLDPDGKIPSNIILEGNSTITATDINITDGVSADKNGNIQPFATVSFNNVGEVALNIYDNAWTYVDADDTPDDCNITINPQNNIPIEAGRRICGSVKTRFIPDHFGLTAKLEDHDKPGAFTYLSDDLNMSAHVILAVRAENADNNITTNFKTGAYENPVTIDLNVTDWNSSLVANRPSPRLDTNITIREISTPTLLGFGTGGDANGTHTIDRNSSTPLLFNYARQIDKPKDPFEIKGEEANLTVTSTYTSSSLLTGKTAPEGSADITGTGLAADSAIFYYGAAQPQKFFYKDVTTNSVLTPVYVTIYCDTNMSTNRTKCTNMGIVLDKAAYSGNDNKWWRAIKHDMTNNDGNVTLSRSALTPHGKVNPADPTPLTIKKIAGPEGGMDNNVTVSRNPGDPIPYTVQIDLGNGTSKWLIYNKTGPFSPTPFEQVEFIAPSSTSTSGNGNWSGLGETGHVVETNASRETDNQRLGW